MALTHWGLVMHQRIIGSGNGLRSVWHQAITWSNVYLSSIGFYTSKTNFIGSTPGPWFNIKMSSYQYRKSHCRDKTILRPSYLHNGICYTGKMSSLYWIEDLISIRKMSLKNTFVKSILPYPREQRINFFITSSQSEIIFIIREADFSLWWIIINFNNINDMDGSAQNCSTITLGHEQWSFCNLAPSHRYKGIW